MSGPRFRGGKPVFNAFGLPTICVGDPALPGDCCALCEAWTVCLSRTPLELQLDGFLVEPWLAWYRWNYLGTTTADNGTVELTSETDASVAFGGTFLAETVEVVCGSLDGDCVYRFQGHDQEVPHYDWLGAPTLCGTHALRHYHTFTTPNSGLDPVHRLYLHIAARCLLNESDEPVIRFSVYLLIYPELDNDGDPITPGWVCCKVLESADIPVDAALDWADLQDVPLLAIPSPTFCHGEPGTDFVGEEDTPDLPELAGATYTVSAVRNSCSLPQDCGFCPQPDPPDPGRLAEPVEIDFSVSVGGCYKTLAAIVPECLDPVGYWWSHGATGATTGLPIGNRDTATGLIPTVEETLVVVDSRGCVYSVTKTLTCECPCPGATGSLSITTRGPTEPGDPYYAVISAAISAPEGCFPFIELCELSSFDQYDDCVECVDLETAHCMAECLTLGPGEEWETVVDVESPITVRCFIWRLWDGPCGCPSEWQKFSLPVGYTDDCGNEIFV